MFKIKTPEIQAIFSIPRLVFTKTGNPKSEKVIQALKALMDGQNEQEYVVFPDEEAIRSCFQGGISPAAAVVLFDDTPTEPMHGPYLTMMTNARPDEASRMPSWSLGARWGVKIHSARNATGCARQLRSDFMRNFEGRLGRGWFPWGMPRKNDVSPMSFELPNSMDEILARLNSGPDFRAAIADTKRALELPQGSRISWIRIATEPIICNRGYLDNLLGALRAFEKAGKELVSGREDIHKMLLAGVDLSDPSLRDFYLFPKSDCFSIDRADLHYTGSGLFASEIDEMPGGFVDAFHVDSAYRLNQERWDQCFRRLCEGGTLLFLVSDRWSSVYLNEFRWLTALINSNAEYGRAEMRTTSELEDIIIASDGVYLVGPSGRERVATIWRQFPIFETSGRLIDLVRAAHEGIVRMIPEFAHFGNKAWFSIFRQKATLFRGKLSPETFGLLQEVLPDSHLVTSPESFPCRVSGIRIEDFYELRNLSEEKRNGLILKVCGANTSSARSYGVLMAHGLTLGTWQEWIDERSRLNQPFIVQRRADTSIATLPVKNIVHGHAELFRCRILLRPWTFDGEIISVAACAVPYTTSKVHGMVDMAVLPVMFGE